VEDMSNYRVQRECFTSELDHRVQWKT
jgi:hypothetical protein